MKRNLEHRLRKLEAQFPPPREKSELSELIPFMSLLERFRLLEGWKYGLWEEDDFREAAHRVIAAASERRDQGWNEADLENLRKLDQSKEDQRWELQRAISKKHLNFYPDVYRFDVADFLLEEIQELVSIVSRASQPSDLSNAAHLIAKLRIDGRSVTVEDFAAIVFEARLGQTPEIKKDFNKL